MPVVVVTAPALASADAELEALSAINAAIAQGLRLRPSDVYSTFVASGTAALGADRVTPWPVAMIHGSARSRAHGRRDCVGTHRDLRQMALRRGLRMGAVDRARVIVAVCANPALDVTYRVPRLEHGTARTVDSTWTRSGGKGTNVARVLHQLGVPVTLVAPSGGPSGTAFRTGLATLPLVSVDIAGTTRTCVAVVDDSDATVFNERGPQVSDAEWAAVLTAVASVLHGGDVLVLSGSLPPGAPPAGYAELVALAKARGARSIVDTHSHPLTLALSAGPDVVAPNHGEARALVGDHDVRTCAELLVGRGADTAVVSAGQHGVFAASGHERWSVTPPEFVAGNPTGAGDALTAAVAAGLHADRPWSDVLREAVACAAAAVACDVAGEIDLAVRDRLLTATTAERH